MSNHVKISIDVGEADIIDLKITSGTMIGTLHIEKKGVSFSPLHSKKAPEHVVDWGRLPRLISLDNGFARAHTQ